jgi:hypothetical protein
MIRLTRYRSVSLSLALLHGLFTVGIPVVIATCSMGVVMDGGVCPGCVETPVPGAHSLVTERTTACCASRIVAEGSCGEFLSAKVSVVEPLQALTAVLSPAIGGRPIGQRGVPMRDTGSLAAPDIPIILSSLLI